jgi:hypothetical protein
VPPDERDELRQRVERLEREVESLRQRLEGRTSFHVEAGPPPVQQHFEAAEREPSWPQVELVQPRPRVSVPEPPRPPRVDTEFKFGSQVLPRAGIVLVLLGILYLVAYAIQTGRITLAWQFAGELSLCAALIGLGLWKLNEKEDFGQVLVGGGSCGLYFSFAGAHVYKDLLTGEGLVLSYVLLSLANLAFSWWRSSKSFWAIGFIGGLIGAALPLDQGSFTATFVLAGLIVSAATLLAAKRAWLRALEALWFVVALYVLFIALDAVRAGVVGPSGAIAIFYGFSLVPLAAHALRFQRTEFDPHGWFEATAGGLTGIATLAFGRPVAPVPHSVAVVVLAVALGALAYLSRKRENFASLVATSVAVACAIAPMGFKAYAAGLLYAAFSLAFSLPVHIGHKSLARPGAMFCAGFTALTVLAYATALALPKISNAQELALLAAIALSVLNLAFCAGKLENKMEAAATAASLALYPVLLRSAFLSAPNWGVYALLFPTAVYAIVVSVVAVRAKWTGPAYVGLFLAAVGTVAYWADASVPTRDGDPWRDIAALAATTVALVLAAKGASRAKQERDTWAVLASCLGAFVVVPMLATALQLPGVRVEEQASFIAAMALYGLGLAIVSRQAKWPGYAIVGMVVVTVSVFVYYDATTGAWVGRAEQIPLVVLAGLAVVATALYTNQGETRGLVSWTIASVIGAFVVSRLFFLVLTLPAIGMQESVAAYTSLALYSLVPACFSLRTKRVPLAFVGGAALALSASLYWMGLLDPMTESFAREGEVAFALLASLATVVCTIAVSREGEERKSLAVVSSLAGWGTLARALQLGLESTGIAAQASITLSWSLYAGIVLALGFVYDARQLRICSLALFGVTLAKVFLVDLSALEAYVRVFLLIAVGGLLILFGYVYVRRRARQPEETSSP